MAQMQGQQAMLELIRANPAFHVASEFVETATARGDGQLVEELAEHGDQAFTG